MSLWRSPTVLLTAVALMLTVALQLDMVWGVRVLTLMDYPNNLAVDVVVRRLLGGEAVPGDLYALRLVPAPNLIFHILVLPLSAVLAPDAAGRLVVSLYLVSFPIALAILLKELAGQVHPVPMLLGAALAINLPFMVGLVNLSLGIVVLMLAIALWARTEPLAQVGMGRRALLVGLWLVAYLCHLVAFAALNLVVLARIAVASGGAQRRLPLLRRWGVLNLLPGALGVWFAVVVARELQIGQAGGEGTGWSIIWGRPVERLQAHHLIDPLALFETVPERAVAAILLLGIAAWLAVAWRTGNRAQHGGLVALVAVYLFGPLNVGPFAALPTRVLVIALVLALTVGAPRAALLRRATPFVAVLPVIWAGLALDRVNGLQERLGQYVDLLEAVPEGALFVSVSVEPLNVGPQIRPLWGAAAWRVVAADTALPSLYTLVYHPLALKRSIYAPFGLFLGPDGFDTEEVVNAYEYVAVAGYDPWLESELRQHYVRRAANVSGSIWGPRLRDLPRQ